MRDDSAQMVLFSALKAWDSGGSDEGIQHVSKALYIPEKKTHVMFQVGLKVYLSPERST